MAVPLLDVTAQNLALGAELQDAFTRVLHSGRYILGEEVSSFENESAARCGTVHGIGVSSGTDALLLALMSLGIGPGDEVLCPSFTFFATAGSIARTGATPVFVDSHANTFNLNAEDADAKVTERTKAILPVHLFGQAADMTAIGQLAKVHSLNIIEDAAQAQGATWEGIPVGGMGDFGAFSFYPTKNLGALGDAGLLTTSNDALAERARVLRNHGMQPKYHHAHVGGNFRLDELQAALLRVKQTQLDEWIALRTGNAAQYQSLLAGTPDLILPAAAPGHSWNQFTVRLPNRERRDALAAHLRAAEIGNEIYYPEPLHQQPCFAHLPTAACPVAEQLADQVLSLPVFPEMTEAHVTEVAQAVSAFCA